jgi:4a-hydroxytetrahydrobiopterin dehydratase
MAEERIVTEKELANRQCVPCQTGAPPLKGEQLTAMATQLGGEWQVVDGHHLEKTYKFKDFRQALDFTNAVGEIAESQGHHPEITLTWGKVTIRIWTHKVGGLTESDFILAAKADKAFAKRG